MIQYFKAQNHMFTKAANYEESDWLHIEEPTKQELKAIADRMEIPFDLMTDPLDIDENSRIESEDGILFLIIRVPVFSKLNEIPFTTVPMGIIIARDKVLTVAPFNNEILTSFKEGKNRPFQITQQNFVLQIFYRTATWYLKHLKEINRRTGVIEKELHQSMKNKELLKLLRLEKCLVYFNTSLRSNELALERLQRFRWLRENEDAADLLEDVIIENKQAIEMANIYSNILNGMMDAFSSIISNNLNIVMKILTAVTIVLMIPNLIFGFYGMNVPTPYQHLPWAWWFSIVFSMFLAILIVIVFRKRKLF
ncbi:MAG TPA: magnesium transporter CorA family protein [Candidatus Cloacimonadota bacterium]|nr:magnesium transporter CorA family protein [Candidatus Cloacimonadota bacterium]HPT71178.1 magnesium transporter CorA family protein [Candidatus Cloacimonadota bacterium]